MPDAAAPSPWAERLKAVQLRVTQPRVTVLHVIEAEPHISAEQVAARVRSRLGAVSTQAIYDTLNTLTERGVLRRFEPAGSAMRFETASGDNHHHFVCRSCGSVVDVPCAAAKVPCAVPTETRAFVVDAAEVTYWGTCAACAARS